MNEQNKDVRQSFATSNLEEKKQLIYRQADRLALILDEGRPLPVLKIKMPLDPILGLVPAFGDAATMFVSGTMLLRCLEAGMPKQKIARMLANIAIDFTFGLIPVFGDIFDFFFRANKRNLKLMKKYLAEAEKSPDRQVEVGHS